MLGIRCPWVGWVLIGLLSACASNNDRGRVLFAEGRFIEAAEVFEHSESQLEELTQQEHARYGLYRGMTLLRLGDFDGAAQWLHYARTVESRAPGSLGRRETTALKQAWQLLDQARAQDPQSPDPLRGALAHSNAANSASAPDVTAADEQPNGANLPDRPVQSTTPNR
jgi:tetratricopeptide (TPR) repeat protein